MSERTPPPPHADDARTSPALSSEQADATIRSRQYAVLLVVVAVIGVVVSLAAWCFLEAIHQNQQEHYTHLPHALGYPPSRRSAGVSPEAVDRQASVEAEALGDRT